MSPTVVSLFTGLGGLDLGLEAAGFSSIGCVEWDEAARGSIQANRGNRWPLLAEADVRRVAETMTPGDFSVEVGELDLLAGAPPCQPYSKAAQWAQGSRQGLLDQRGSYLRDMLAIAEILCPKVVIIENVPGFVGGRTSALPFIESEVTAINRRTGYKYQVAHSVLDAADYGVPQHRRRAIVVLHRLQRAFEWPASVPTRTAWDALGQIEDSDPLPVAKGKWAGLLASIPEGENYLWHTDRGGGLPLFGWRRRYWSFLLKLDRNRPSWTLPASPGPSNGPFHWDNRPLSSRELLALQSFPTSWIVEGSQREQTRQIGNATPPLLAEVLGRSLRSYLGLGPIRRPPTYLLPKLSPGSPANSVASVPEKYLHLVGDHPDHPGSGLGPGAIS